MGSLLRCACFALAVYGCALPSVRACPPDSLRIELRGEATVEGARTMLTDIAVVRAGSVQLQREAETIDVGPAPMVGQPAAFLRTEVEAIARRRLSRLACTLQFSGPGSVKILRASQAVDARKIAESAVAALALRFTGEQGRLELTPMPVAGLIEAPLGSLTLATRDTAPASVKPRMTVWVDVLVDGHVYRSVAVGIVVKLFRDVLVARRALRLGDTLDARDVEATLMDVAGLPEVFPAAAPFAQQHRMVQAINAGEVLLRKHVPATSMVLRGDVVRLLSGGGSVTVETVATALDSAAVGSNVAVQGTHGERVIGRVISSTLVQVR